MGLNDGVNGNMGINRLGDPTINFKRKFRYTFAVQPKCPGLGLIEPWFVKVAGRPSYSLDETELNFLNEKTWIPGKVTFDEMNVTYIDVSAKEPASANLYRWLGAAYQFWNTNRKMGVNANQYAADAVLTLYDGCGGNIEQWSFQDIWPKSVKFGEMDNTSSDTVDIELSLRYSKFTYKSFCGAVNFIECCAGC